ncbi:hypothetical protein F4775DRAFT_558422 [Biscogniauxia sp. FL1348]|nr:hypothetical protein F4775DRAFT_558422 [Biscogniauxia sp. FL1348]
MASRQGLPNELLELIFQHLYLPPLILGSELPDRTFVENRAALRSLCRTSRLFLDLTRPLLYEKVVLYIDEENLTADRELLAGSKSLVLLIRTLTQRPGLRAYVKYVACPMLLHTSPWWHNDDRAELVSASWKYSKADFTGLSADDQIVFGLAGLDISHAAPPKSEDEESKIAEQLLAVLVCLASSLETLLLQTMERQKYKILHQTITRALKHERLRHRILPNLRTLQFQLPPRSVQTSEFGRAQCATIYECPVLLTLPSVRRIEARHDELSYADDFSWAGKIEELDLVSQTSADTYQRLCERAGSLRRLSIDMFNFVALDMGGDETDLNAAIALLARTLQELRAFTRYRDDYDDYLSPTARLTCLPRLERLEVLGVDRKALFRTEAELAERGFADRLPPNLQVLDLYEDWRRPGGAGHGADVDVDHEHEHEHDEDSTHPRRDAMYTAAFVDLAARRHERLPKLGDIALWPSNRYRKHARLELGDETLAEIKRALCGAGVAFRWLRRWPQEGGWDDA